jgi:hypothetical protein
MSLRISIAGQFSPKLSDIFIMFGNVVPLDNFTVKIHGTSCAYDFHVEHCIGLRELVCRHIFKYMLSFKAKFMMHKGHMSCIMHKFVS